MCQIIQLSDHVAVGTSLSFLALECYKRDVIYACL